MPSTSTALMMRTQRSGESGLAIGAGLLTSPQLESRFARPWESPRLRKGGGAELPAASRPPGDDPRKFVWFRCTSLSETAGIESGRPQADAPLCRLGIGGLARAFSDRLESTGALRTHQRMAPPPAPAAARHFGRAGDMARLRVGAVSLLASYSIREPA
jgi:hypothetical protein